MANIDLADCTVTSAHVSGIKIVKIVTPATADTGDTITVSSLFVNGQTAIATNASDGTNLCNATSYSTEITLPGSSDNEARTIIAIGE